MTDVRVGGLDAPRPRSYFSSQTMTWATPPDLFADLHTEFQFSIDVCAAPETACLPRFWTERDDALLRSWAGERVWMNPPYGRQVLRWVEKAWTEAGHADVIVALVPSRTDTYWWHEYAMTADEIRFVRRRLAFGRGGQKAPFPSSLLVWRKP